MAGAPADRFGITFWLTIGFVSVGTLAAALSGMPALAILPILAAALVSFLLRAPLRVPTLTLLFLGLVLDNPADIGPWKSPLFPLGELFLTQLKKIIPIDVLVVTGMDAALGLLLLMHFHRRLRGVPVDSHPVVKPPQELIVACLAGIAAVLFAWFFGLATGVAYACFLLAQRHANADVRRPAGPLFDATLSAAVCSLLIGLPLGEVDLVPSWPAHGWLILLALSVQVGGWLLISISLPRLPAAITSVVLTLQPVGSVLLGVWILNEVPSTLQLVGVGLILVGLLVTTLRVRSRPWRAAQPEVG